jgi:hypothetical protein
MACALMWALLVNIDHVFCEGMPESTLSKDDHAEETLLLDRAHLPLRVGIQIGAPRWSRHPRHPRRIDDLLKRRAELAVSVVDEVLPGLQEAPVRHGAMG